MNWDEIRKEYETSKITLKALAEKHDIKIGTLKSRKSREGWSRDPTKKDATKKEKVASPEPVIESDELTDKQKLFCLHYIKYFNATKAYQKAYECDYFSAKAHGYKLLQNVAVKNEIERLNAEQQQELFLSSQAVLQKYIDIAFADITDYVDFGQREQQVMTMYGPLFEKNKDGKIDRNKPVMETVNYIDIKESTAVDGTIVTEVKQGKDGVSVKLADRMKALDKLWEYFDMLPDSYKRKLQEEKLKADIAKTKAEVEQISTKSDDKPIEIIIKRKRKGEDS